MELVSEDMKLAVKRGINWLDENHPGWEYKINISTLRMSDCRYCILGQAVGNYAQTIINISYDLGYGSVKWACDHGFNLPLPGVNAPSDLKQYNNNWDTLHKLWAEEINNRFG